MKKTAGIAAVPAVLALAFALSAALAGSPLESLSSSLSLALFVAPGIPMARLWFSGYRAILVGAALGYLASSLAASLLVRLELLSHASVLGASAVLLLLAVAARSSARPRHEMETGERVWLAASFLLVLLVVSIPFLRVGEEVGDGFAFRAYFSADLMTHLSVAAELQKGTYPPVNPYYAGDRLGYYWLFFAWPAAAGYWTSNQGALLVLYLASGLLFTGLFFMGARELGLSPPRAFFATAIVVTAVSYEGVLAAARSVSGIEPFWSTNVDAFGRWVLGLVSLDGLHRSLLYTPQHLFSYSLLVVLLVLVLRGEPESRGGAILAGVLLGGMAGTSIVTAMLAGPWLGLVLLARREPLPRLLELSLLVAAPALALLAWFVALGFFGDAGGALAARRPAWLEIPFLLFVETGALVLLCLFRERLGRKDLEIAGLAALALVAVLFLDLEGYEGIWMAWRAGSVLLVALGFLAAPSLSGRLGPAKALVVVPAVLTVVLDVYNAQNVENREVSAGEFRWTTVVSHGEWEALRWLAESTAPDAVVQWDVRARELGEWALLPALAERRMAVGSPIFLLDLRKYRVRERRHVRPIFSTASASEAYRLALGLGIDYLFIGRRELTVRGEGLRKLFEAPELFRTAFSNDAVTILEVVRR